jgi:hypothetical protein
VRLFAFVAVLAVAVFGLPIITAAILGNIVIALLSTLFVAVACYAAVLLVMRIRARRGPKPVANLH